MHFIVGFELSASHFPRQFLDFFELQMHHLGSKSVLYLAGLATLCEGYVGFSMFPTLFHLFFHFRAQKNDNMTYSWDEVDRILQNVEVLLLLCLQHQGGRDWVNLPPYSDTPPTGTN
ncbi:hypothetical protein D1007_26596 [Hordeum vulgare]|nr:hypothetical protein D1007_26596 [Hordeum vulgare]